MLYGRRRCGKSRLLLDELRDLTQVASILTLIGQGCHRLSEIAGRLGKPATSLSRPMGRLVELGLVRRDQPFGASTRDSKRSLYRIGDPFLVAESTDGAALLIGEVEWTPRPDPGRLHAEIRRKVKNLPFAHERELVVGVWTRSGTGRAGHFGPDDILRALQ